MTTIQIKSRLLGSGCTFCDVEQQWCVPKKTPFFTQKKTHFPSFFTKKTPHPIFYQKIPHGVLLVRFGVGGGGGGNSGNREPEWSGWESVRMGGSDNKGDGSASQPVATGCQGNPCSTGIRWGVSPAAQMGCLRNRSGSPSGADHQL